MMKPITADDVSPRPIPNGKDSASSPLKMRDTRAMVSRAFTIPRTAPVARVDVTEPGAKSERNSCDFPVSPRGSLLIGRVCQSHLMPVRVTERRKADGANTRSSELSARRLKGHTDSETDIRRAILRMVVATEEVLCLPFRPLRTPPSTHWSTRRGGAEVKGSQYRNIGLPSTCLSMGRYASVSYSSSTSTRLTPSLVTEIGTWV